MDKTKIAERIDDAGLRLERMRYILDATISNYLDFDNIDYPASTEREKAKVYSLCAQYPVYRALLDVIWDETIALRSELESLSEEIYPWRKVEKEV